MKNVIRNSPVIGGQQGIALVSAILLTMVLTFVATTVISLLMTELKIASNHRSGTEAFYNAEAGAAYVTGMIKNRFGDLDLQIGSTSTNAISFSYPAPATTAYPMLPESKAPFDTWTQVNLYSKNITHETDYRFQVTGFAANGSSKVEVVVRIPIVPKGIFGFEGVSIKNKFSMDNSLNPANKPTFGSNGTIEIKNGGDKPDVILGLGGSAAEKDVTTMTTVSASIAIDPLDATSLVAQHAGTKNDNATSDITDLELTNTLPAISNLKPGAYYVTSIPSSISSLTIKDVPTEDTVFIFYHGIDPTKVIDLSAATINPAPSDPSKPKKKLILISDTANELSFSGSGPYNMVLYAPNAKVTFKNNAIFEGLIWAKSIEAKNNFTFKYDKNVAPFLAPPIQQLSWKLL